MVKSLLLLVVTAAFACAASPLVSAAADLVVKVIDQDTKEPIPMAAIFVGTAARADADAQGRYRFENLPAGEIQVRAEHVGYMPWRGTKRLEEKKPNTMSIKMQPRIQTIEPIDVTGVRPDPSVPQQTREKLASEIRRGAGTVATDPVRAIQSTPGGAAAAGDDFNNRYVIRGGDPEENVILYDGYTLLQPFHLEGFTSVIYDDLIGGMTVYPGALPPHLGEALSSVTIFDSIVPKKRREYFRYDLGSIALGAERRQENVHAEAAARASFYNLLLRRPPDVKDRSFQDLTGRLIFPKETYETGVTLLASRDREEGLLDRSVDAYLVGARIGTPKQPRKVNTAISAAGRDREQVHKDQNERVTTSSRSDLTRLTAHADVLLPFGPHWQVRADAEARQDDFEGNRVERVGSQARWDTTAAKTSDNGFFGSVEGTWSGQIFSASAGGRIESIPFAKGTPFSPYISARFRGLDWATLGAGYRIVRQSPFPLFDNPTIAGIPVEPADLLNAAEGDIEPLEARHYSATADFKAGGGFGASIEAYVKEYDKLTTWPDPLGPTAGDVTSGGDGLGRGVEITLRSDSTRYVRGWVTYSKSKTRKHEGPALGMHPADHDRPDMIQVSLDVPFRGGTNLNFFYRRSTGRPTTPVTVAGIPDVNRINEDRLRNYTRLDVKLEHRVIGDKRDAFFYLDVLNLFNTKNDGDPVSYVYQDRVIIIPQQGVRITPIAGFGIYFY